MMSHWLQLQARRHRCTVALAIALVACSIPTGDMCGCPPAVSSFVVAGRVQGAVRGGVRATRIEFSGSPTTRSDTAWSQSDLVSGSPTFTDSLDAFQARLLSLASPGLHLLRMRVISNGGRDTTRVALGTVRFAAQGQRPDSIFVAVVVP